jgi:hypothetical protein
MSGENNDYQNKKNFIFLTTHTFSSLIDEQYSKWDNEF